MKTASDSDTQVPKRDSSRFLLSASSSALRFIPGVPLYSAIRVVIVIRGQSLCGNFLPLSHEFRPPFLRNYPSTLLGLFLSSWTQESPLFPSFLQVFILPSVLPTSALATIGMIPNDIEAPIPASCSRSPLVSGDDPFPSFLSSPKIPAHRLSVKRIHFPFASR